MWISSREPQALREKLPSHFPRPRADELNLGISCTQYQVAIATVGESVGEQVRGCHMHAKLVDPMAFDLTRFLGVDEGQISHIIGLGITVLQVFQRLTEGTTFF